MLGDANGLTCLDIGSDNGVISFLLRREGGTWKSADLDAQTVQSIRDLVGDDVWQIDGIKTAFADDEFDRVVIVDFLEHIATDREFVVELYRIIKPGGELIVNVPHIKKGLLRRFRIAIGQTDERHGHLRPGYTIENLKALFQGRFQIASARTYSKFFSEAVDTLITWGVGFFKKDGSKKGVVFTGQDMTRHKKLFAIYSMIYPIVWFFARLDGLLSWTSGYMLIVRAPILKSAGGTPLTGTTDRTNQK